MGRRLGVASRWGIEAAATAVCALLVIQELETVHPQPMIRAVAVTAVALVAAAIVVGATAQARATGVAVIALAVLVEGAMKADDARLAVIAFALTAAVPLVALANRQVATTTSLLVGATVLAILARLVWRDPFRELHCEPFCGSNPYLVGEHPDLLAAIEWLLVATTIFAIVRQAAGTRNRTAAVWLRWSVGALWIAGSVLRLRPIPGERVDVVLHALLLALIGLLAGAHMINGWTALMTRRKVREFTSTLATAVSVEAIQHELRGVTRDENVSIELALDGEPRLGANGFVVSRSGRTIAIVHHQPRSGARVSEAVTPAVAMALETQLLLEEARRRVDEVNASRTRAVTSIDDARRTLERNLHDGAQQYLLVCGIAVADAANRNPAGCWDSVADDLGEALRELRRIGRGDAATIAELGLANAVTALPQWTDIEARIRVEPCTDEIHECWPITTATTIYRLFVAWIAGAAQAGASTVVCEAQCGGPGGGRMIEVGHDGVDPSDWSIDLDRILAAGGQALSAHDPSRRRVEAWLP